jgi:4-diphosphocytidyl-2-C-methyl-D-erythritol kinase
MNNWIDIEAFAKINIGLGIGNQDSNGYHTISSIFHAINLSDLIRIEIAEKPGIEIHGYFDCPLASTTIYKAASLIIDRFSLEQGFRITVEKRIPVKAGLGGGSADAAGVLKGMVRLCSLPLHSDEMEKAGAAIGSDVPFFLHGGAAYVSGRGERVKAIAPRNDLFMLLVYPGFGVSTGEAFRGLDEFRKGQGCAPTKLMSMKESLAMYKSSPAEWKFKNDFTEYLENLHPLLREIDTYMRKTRALYVSPTGSGSCIYGIYDSYDSASNAKLGLYANLVKNFREKTIEGLALYAIKPLETSLVIR